MVIDKTTGGKWCAGAWCITTKSDEDACMRDAQTRAKSNERYNRRTRKKLLKMHVGEDQTRSAGRLLRVDFGWDWSLAPVVLEGVMGSLVRTPWQSG